MWNVSDLWNMGLGLARSSPGALRGMSCEAKLFSLLGLGSPGNLESKIALINQMIEISDYFVSIKRLII